MSGLFNDDTLSLYLKLKEAMKQYVRDAMPGGSLNAEVPNYPQMIADQAKAQQDTLRDAWGDPNKMADATLGMMNGAMGSFLPFGMVGKAAPVAPRAAAMETARKNAVEMLGLPENNTAMDRARALGIDIPAYRGTSADEVIAGDNARGGWVSASDSPKEASFYAISSAMKKTGNKGIDGANVMPLLIKPDSVFASGIGSNELLVKNPANIRSRFAAFDPARINEADLLGQVRPDFLPYLFGTGLLGAYGVSKLEAK